MTYNRSTSSGPRKPRNYEKVSLFDLHARNYNSRLPNSRYWGEVEHIDIYDGNYVYCETYRHEIINAGVNTHRLANIIRKLNELGVQTEPIYAVKKTKKVKDLPNWKPLRKYLEEERRKLLASYDVNLAQVLEENDELIRIAANTLRHQTIRTFEDDHLLQQLVHLKSTNLKNVAWLVDKMPGCDTIVADSQGKSGALVEEIKTRYAFMLYFNPWKICESTIANSIVQAINALDLLPKLGE